MLCLVAQIIVNLSYPVEFVIILLEFCYSFFVTSEIYAPWSAPTSRFCLKNIVYNLPGKITTGSSHQSLIVQDKQDAHLGNSPPPFPPSSAPSSSSPWPADSPVPSITWPYPFSPLWSNWTMKYGRFATMARRKPPGRDEKSMSFLCCDHSASDCKIDS